MTAPQQILQALIAPMEDRRIHPLCANLTPQGHVLTPPHLIMNAAIENDAKVLSVLLGSLLHTLPDFGNDDGVSPLMAAAARGNAEVAEMLAAHPLTNVNRACGIGWTALHFAVFFGRKETARVLLKHKADADIRTPDGKTAMELTDDEGVHAVFRERLSRTAPKISPFAHGFNEKAHVPELRTLADLAHWDRRGMSYALGALCEKIKGMDVDAFDTVLDHYRGKSFSWDHVFCEAARRNNLPVLMRLEQFMYETLMSPPDEKTLNRALSAALSHDYAWKTGKAGIVKFLVLLGADPNARFRRTEISLGTNSAQLFRGNKEEETNFEFSLICEDTGHLTQMAVWADKISIGKKQKLPSFIERIIRARKECAGANAGELEKAMKSAVIGRNLAKGMAVYAESRKDRLFRSPVPFTKGDAGKLFLQAVLGNEILFAEQLLADGNIIAPGEFHMNFFQTLATPEQKKFVSDVMAGKIRPQPIMSAVQKRKNIRALQGYWSPIGYHY